MTKVNIDNMMQVKLFGSLVKGLRTGLDLLIQVQKEGCIITLSKVVKLPRLSGNGGLDQFLTQFEAAVDSEFPNYQVFLYHLIYLI